METEQGNMKREPLVSVLMGVYYHRSDTAMLKRSVGSILRQSISELELLICDDGSSEAACDFVTTMAKKDKRIRLVRNCDAFDLAAKLNRCLELARGQWIARMDDDDYSHPERFAKQLAYLRQNPEAAFVGSNVNVVRGGEIVGERRFVERPRVEDFFFRQPFIHPSLMFRKEALEAVGGYSEDRRCQLCEDYDLLLRLYQAGFQGANLQETLLDYSVPETAKGSRKMRHRWNEAATRYQRFKELGVLPRAWPYVVKPLAVGVLPEFVLRGLKKRL